MLSDAFFFHFGAPIFIPGNDLRACRWKRPIFLRKVNSDCVFRLWLKKKKVWSQRRSDEPTSCTVTGLIANEPTNTAVRLDRVVDMVGEKNGTIPFQTGVVEISTTRVFDSVRLFELFVFRVTPSVSFCYPNRFDLMRGLFVRHWRTFGTVFFTGC